jgi:cytochrome P450
LQVLTFPGPLVKASEKSPEDSKGAYLTKQEVIANSWIILFAGHETSANIAHLSLLFLAIELEQQAHMQKDIDSIAGTRSSEDWSYETDLGRFWNSMIGATINETLRLMPPIIDVPKIVRDAPQPLTFDGKTASVPTSTMIHISAVGVQRNPRYWPHSASKLSSKKHDLDDWVPERWFSSTKKTAEKTTSSDSGSEDGENTASFDTTDGLLVPPKGVFMPFSEGARACPGRRFAQVEITAVLAVIFNTYSLELDVSEWASDAQVEKMSKEERRAVYQKAMTKARKLIFASQSEIFLQMRGNYPVRFVKRGDEKFMGCYVE